MFWSLVSLRNRKIDGKKRTAKRLGLTNVTVLFKWSSLKLMFSGLLQRLFKGVWIACERQTFLLADRRWGTFREKEPPRETSLSGDEREETSAVRRLHQNQHKSISFTSSCCPWKMQVESYFGELFKTYLHYIMLIFIIISLFYYFKLITYYIDA